MPDLLLELYSEEIPARMQRDAAAGLRSHLCKKLSAFSITFVEAAEYSTPRRVCIAIKGLPDSSPVQKIERKGPREDAPEKALSGFLRSAGATAENLELREEKKGRYYFAVLEVPGRPLSEIVTEAVGGAVQEFVWPKSMVWGAGHLRWVRPLHSILCILQDETGGSTVDFEVEGIRTGNATRGHRFMSASEFQVASFDAYKEKLEEAFVILDPEDRKERIRAGAERLAAENGLHLVNDPELLDENAGLTEWPVPMIGAIDERFLELPNELLTASMKQHQKYLSAVEPESGKVSHFVMVANRETRDNGEAMLAGNLRVLNSRLEDAEFYWKNDTRSIKTGGLESFAAKLRNMNFHHELGNMAQRVSRISAISEFLADEAGAEARASRRAAELSKIDLVSETVNEFPELQGKVGRRLALLSGEEEAIADACEQHYMPAGPNDPVPSEPLAVAVGLADRIDYMVGFFGIGDISTGSKDPHGLRRAALGVIRLILDNEIRTRLLAVFDFAWSQYANANSLGSPFSGASGPETSRNLLAFLHERLAVYLRTAGIRHDWMNACVTASDADDLVLLKKRAASLGGIVRTDDGLNLIEAFKRVNNILASEERKGATDLNSRPERELLQESEEKELLDGLETASRLVNRHIKEENFSLAAAAVAELRPSIDNFFDHVLVNSPSPDLRRNRLRLLGEIRATCLQIADLTKVNT